MFGKIIHLHIQTVKQRQFKTIIRLISLFPGNIPVIITPYCYSVLCIIKVRTKTITLTTIICIYLRQIEETVIFVTNSIISYQTIRIFQFKLREHLLQRFPEFFIGNIITYTDSRKKAIALGTIKTFGTIITEVKFSHIPIIKSIGKTTGQSLITIGQRLLQIIFL